VLLHKIGDNLLVGFEGFDGGGLVVLHEAAVTYNIGTEDSGKFTLELVLCHDPPL
jgi:hypothetical protein